MSSGFPSRSESSPTLEPNLSPSSSQNGHRRQFDHGQLRFACHRFLGQNDLGRAATRPAISALATKLSAPRQKLTKFKCQRSFRPDAHPDSAAPHAGPTPRPYFHRKNFQEQNSTNTQVLSARSAKSAIPAGFMRKPEGNYKNRTLKAPLRRGMARKCGGAQEALFFDHQTLRRCERIIEFKLRLSPVLYELRAEARGVAKFRGVASSVRLRQSQDVRKPKVPPDETP